MKEETHLKLNSFPHGCQDTKSCHGGQLAVVPRGKSPLGTRRQAERDSDVQAAVAALVVTGPWPSRVL